MQNRQSFTVPSEAGEYAPETLTFGHHIPGIIGVHFATVTALIEEAVDDAVIELWLPSVADETEFLFADEVFATDAMTKTLADVPAVQIRVKSGGTGGDLVLSAYAETGKNFARRAPQGPPGPPGPQGEPGPQGATGEQGDLTLADLRAVLLGDRLVAAPNTLAKGSSHTTVNLTGTWIIQKGATAGGANSYHAVNTNANLAFGALGTIPGAKWGAVAIQATPVPGGAASLGFQTPAANFTTGYDTEAAALAALRALASTAGTVRVAVVTILAHASGFVFGTDALAGGTGGNPAQTTNYYTAGYDFAGLLADPE